MRQGREGGDGANSALKNALRKITRRGRAGATAKEINPDESAGLALAAQLVRRKLIVATAGNRFILTKYAAAIRSEPFIADDDGRAVRVEHPYRAPLPRLHPTSKPVPVDITGLPVTKLPPGEAIGARDLQRWHSSKCGTRSTTDIKASVKRKRMRQQRRDENCLTARALKSEGQR